MSKYIINRINFIEVFMKKILVIFGSDSFEHEISCKSAKCVLQNLDYEKFDVTVCGINLNNEWFLYNDDIKKIDKNWNKCNIKHIDNIINFCKAFDLVLPIIHGKNGEDGKLQGFFDLFNINYIGCDQLSSTIAYSKYLTKIYVEKLGIPQLPYVLLKNVNEIKKINFDFPVIIKPNRGGSSIGICVVNKEKQLKKALKNAFKYDNMVLVEKFIHARELECAILKSNKFIVSEVGEILKEKEFYDFESKYVIKNKTVIADIPEDIKIKIKNLSKEIFNNLNCNDLSRIDFLYDSNHNKIYFNEINTMPGFTDISMYPVLLNNSGINFKSLLTMIINNH